MNLLIFFLQQAGELAGDLVETTPVLSETAEAAQTMNLWDLAVKGGWIMIVLAVLSLIAFYILFERYYVIKRADKIVHLVEMKFSETPFAITKAYENHLQERKNLFMEVTGIPRGVVHTFISPKGLSKGMHSSIVHSQLTAEDLFAEVRKFE